MLLPKRGIHVCFMTLLLLSISVSGQHSKDSLFAEVPTSIRAQFIERLNLLVEAMRAQRYEDAYMLLSKSYTVDESREAFVARLKRFYSDGDKIINFVPEGVGVHAEAGKEPTDFIVGGCLEIRKNKRKLKVTGSVHVVVENGDLYFSRLGPSRTLDGKYVPCN